METTKQELEAVIRHVVEQLADIARRLDEVLGESAMLEEACT